MPASAKHIAGRLDHAFEEILPDIFAALDQRRRGAMEIAVDQVLAVNADKVAEYKSGKDKLFGFFVGQTMKAMAGKGNPALINEILKQRLSVDEA